MISVHFYNRLKATWYPSRFQGWGRQKSYFEGWYYKLVNRHQTAVLAVIPGVAYAPKEDHAFIQVIDGTNRQSSYHVFPIESFSAAKNEMRVQIDANIFSDQGIHLQLPNLKGSLQFSHQVPWPRSISRPGVMGWYSFMPFMQCYHGLVSMDHNLRGSLELGDTLLDMDSGKGYIEKDWGSSFPRSWIWTQCNHYQGQKLSVMASVAHIPWRNSFFIGFLALIWTGQKLKIFTTYTDAQMKAEIGVETVTLAFQDRREKLEIRAIQAPGAVLKSPIDGEMKGKVNESMQAIHEVTYRRADGTRLIAQGTSAGLEVAGDVDELLTDAWRK